MTDDPEQELSNADMTGKDLSGADLRDKDLSRSDFSRGRLCETKLQKAQLYGTIFHFADLSRAEFRDGQGSSDAVAGSQAKGLLAASLAGSNLEGALLPVEIASFDRLHNVEEVSKNGTTILLAMLAVCLFCLLTAGTFSDAALITNSGSTAAIPGVGLALPVGPFLYAAPFLLLAFHLYFILNLQRYEELISDLPSIFPDGVPLHLKIYPWLFSSLIPLARARMRQFGPKARLVLEDAR